MKLVIGNKNYSSWSLRAWLILKAFGVAFTEEKIFLDLPDTEKRILHYSRAGFLPVLIDGDLVIWDSLAICEYVSERYLGGAGWPGESGARAKARSCAAEMHSGFAVLRSAMPMNCRAQGRKVPVTPDLQWDIDRIEGLWSELLVESAATGPYLFGDFSIVDCMYAPVVSRFATYGVRLSERAGTYVKNMLAHPALKEWFAGARGESEIIEADEAGECG